MAKHSAASSTSKSGSSRLQKISSVKGRGRSPRSPKAGNYRWSDALDQCLRNGLAQGRRGVREATDRLMAQCAGLTRQHCWQRLRWLREHDARIRPEGGAWPAELIELLQKGYLEGGAVKRAAFRAVRLRYPDLPGHVISRMARKKGWISDAAADAGGSTTRRRWTEAEQKHFSSMAEHRCVSHMAQALDRSPQAIRWRLGARSLSARATDAWSLHRLERTLHVSHMTLQHWIAEHDLRVRDAHITGSSLHACVARALYEDVCPTPSTLTTTPAASVHPGRKYRWKEAVELLGHRDAVRQALALGELKLVDAKVSDRALETFCRRRAAQRLNAARIDPAIHQWLVSEYRLPVLSGLKASHLFALGRKRHGLVRFTGKSFVDERSVEIDLKSLRADAMTIVGAPVSESEADQPLREPA
jgi:hypothetical protein